ncbi:cilia- and flagella-associated protein 53 [Carcharodon carcharias]|uniref:cilia- and flagella-associated protein 53 n=1 Tax=Carcharodon carcharias TaxID=13397 RepID=UPI001B7DA1FA|nr:cilia- and flagella-associated protein 53 [Carcharodon carcharias]
MAAKCRKKSCGREVKGPTPCSVGLLAKSSGNFANLDMMKELKLDLIAEDYANFVKAQKRIESQNCTALENEQTKLKNNIRYMVQKAMEFYKQDIEQRRERLRDLLEAEEKEHLNQLSLMGETPLEQQAKIRQHVKDLKIKRERERQKLIAEKLDQQFREQCEELQTKLSHQRELELVKDRKVQIEFNKKLQNQQKEEEQMYEELWEKDRLAKEERMEKEMREQNEKLQEVLAGLQEQMAEANAKRMDQKRLKEEEAKAMKEKQRLSRLEDERLAREKAQKQKEFRVGLNRSMALKTKRLAKEKEEERALDTKIKEQTLKESSDVAKEQLQKKLDLQRELQTYRKYLAQKADDDKRNEEEANRLIEADMEKTWAKRSEQMRLKKEAQDRHKKEVMETRKLQVQELLEKNMKNPQQVAEERAKIIQSIEEQKKVDEERLARGKRQNKAHQQDLLAQMRHQKQQAEIKKAEEQREVEAGKLEEAAYQKKIQDALSQPHTGSDKIHPWRKENCINPKLNEVC